MIVIVKRKTILVSSISILLVICLIVAITLVYKNNSSNSKNAHDNSTINYIYEEVSETVETMGPSPVPGKKLIKWVEFKVSYIAMEHALKADVATYQQPVKINWIDLLSYLGAKYGGDFKRYKSKDMEALVTKLKDGEKLEDLTQNMKYFTYYFDAYSAVLGGLVGEYQIEIPDPADKTAKIWKKTYGIKAFSPIAKGYGYGDYDDFGNSRDYGYKRRHLGHDMMGGVGTPIIAVESGIIEVAAWNKYGGWRIGVRSLDKKRYYYYAHMRKNWPFHKEIKEGMVVNAGDVIGYLGMTGYSNNENVNGIRQPHLHFGLQLVFDESQKECVNEIWVDVYNITKLLQKSKSAVAKDPETKDYYRVFEIQDPAVLVHCKIQ